MKTDCFFLRIDEQVSTDADILNLIRSSMSTVYHASATCAMGFANDTNAVVDSKANK